MAKTTIEGARLYEFTRAGSLGVVQDTLYLNCFWPRSDEPFAPFAEGSSGIEVQGPPTPRNIIFPKGTLALAETRLDCHFIVEYPVEAVEKQVTVIDQAVVKGEIKTVAYKESQFVDAVVRRVTPVKVDAEAAVEAVDAVRKVAAFPAKARAK